MRRLIIAAIAVLSAASPSGVAKEVAGRDGAHVQRPSWSPDGRQVAYEANFHDKKVVELYVGDPRSAAFRRIQPVVRGASTIAAGFGGGGSGAGAQVVHEISWSPPSLGRFVYTATNDAQDYDIYTMTGGAVASGPGADGGGAWSPDGQHVAFTSARTGQGDLYLTTFASAGAPPKRLTRDDDAAELFATWSPDSQRLAFVGKGSKGDNIWLLPSLTGTPVQLTAWPGTQTAPRFSPDGNWIAFFANRDAPERFDLFLVETRGGATPQKVLADVVVNPGGPRFTPDGRHLVVVCNDDARFDPLCAVEAKAGATARVLDLGTVGHGDLDVVKAGDGTTWIAYAAQGNRVDNERTFKRLFIAQLPAL